jgi:hypothetical protein
MPLSVMLLIEQCSEEGTNDQEVRDCLEQ